jgi:hypothetical protein
MVCKWLIVDEEKKCLMVLSPDLGLIIATKTGPLILTFIRAFVQLQCTLLTFGFAFGTFKS